MLPTRLTVFSFDLGVLLARLHRRLFEGVFLAGTVLFLSKGTALRTQEAVAIWLLVRVLKEPLQVLAVSLRVVAHRVNFRSYQFVLL